MQVRLLTGADLRGSLLPFLVQVYTAAFSEPPYRGVDAAAFAETLLRHSESPGFRAVVIEEAGGVAGFGYGYASRPGGWWHDRVRPLLEAGATRSWLAEAFEVVELAVAPWAQGRGLGARLHDRLLEAAASDHRRALLSTLEAETRAMHLYRRRGWQVLLQGFRFGAGDPYRILGRRLRPASAAEAAGARVRPARADDVEGIRAVACGTWAETYRGLIPVEVQNRLLAAWYAPEALGAGMEQEGASFMVAEEAGAVCGFAQMGRISPEVAELHRICVLPAYQGLGLGARLYEAALQAVDGGSPPVRAVEASVEEGNDRGRRFYERLGFRPAARLQAPLPGGGHLPMLRYRLERS